MVKPLWDVRIDETEPPASEELIKFRGRTDLLRQIVENDLQGEKHTQYQSKDRRATHLAGTKESDS